MRNKDCKVVQDLLPNYIEKLTSEETNKFIEEHLQNCSECKDMLESMKEEIKINTAKPDDREVEYIKKFNVKFKKVEYKLFVLIYTILVIIVLAIIAYLGRKYFIVQDLLEKLDKYSQKTNYYVKYDGYKDALVPFEIWAKGGTAILKYNDELLDKTIICYKDGKAYEYRNGENDIGDITDWCSKELTLGDYCFQLKAERQILEDIKTIFDYSIAEEILNGKKCYRFKENDQMGNIFYIEKETGLVLRFENHGNYGEPRTIIIDEEQINSFTDYQYEFDIVTDKDVDIELRKQEVVVNGKFDEKVELVQDNFKVSVSNVKYDSEKELFYTDIEFTTLDNHTISDGVYFDYEIFNNNYGYFGSTLDNSYQTTFEDVPIATKVDDKTVKYHIEISNFRYEDEYEPDIDKMLIRLSNVKFPNSEYDGIYQDNLLVSFEKDFVFILEK